jgi:hypothetical protein
MNDFAAAWTARQPFAASPPTAIDLHQKPPPNEDTVAQRDPPGPPEVLEELFLGHVWWGANESFVKWLLESVCHVAVYALRIKLRKQHGRFVPSGTWYATVLAVDVDRVERFTEQLQLCVAQVPPGARPQLAVVSRGRAQEFASEYQQRTGIQVKVLEAFVMERSRDAAAAGAQPFNVPVVNAIAVAMSTHDNTPTSLPPTPPACPSSSVTESTYAEPDS